MKYAISPGSKVYHKLTGQHTGKAIVMASLYAKEAARFRRYWTICDLVMESKERREHPPEGKRLCKNCERKIKKVEEIK